MTIPYNKEESLFRPLRQRNRTKGLLRLSLIHLSTRCNNDLHLKSMISRTPLKRGGTYRKRLVNSDLARGNMRLPSIRRHLFQISVSPNGKEHLSKIIFIRLMRKGLRLSKHVLPTSTSTKDIRPLRSIRRQQLVQTIKHCLVPRNRKYANLRDQSFTIRLRGSRTRDNHCNRRRSHWDGGRQVSAFF